MLISLLNREGDTMRILLAEDERSLSRAVVALLEKSNYSADAVYDGEEALAYLEAGNYDGVILDIMMPKMDGLTVLRQVRESGNGIPILLLTAKSQVDDRIRGLDMGADDYLVKPFAMGELLARIRAMTRRRTETATNLLRFGDLALSRETFNLSGPAGEQRLGNKEFQILELMMEHPNRVIPTDQFFSRIWGYDTDAELGVVWVYISGLRKRLQAVGSAVEIKANRGVGYLLANREAAQ